MVEFDVEVVMKNGEAKPQARDVRLLAADAPTVSVAGSTGHRGSLKFWSPEGYGFLVDEDSSLEYYTNAVSVPSGYLHHGDVVHFDVEKTDDRSQATNVTVVDWKEVGDRYSDNLDLGPSKVARQTGDARRARALEL